MTSTGASVAPVEVLDIGEDGDGWALLPPLHVPLAVAVPAVRAHLADLGMLDEAEPIDEHTLVVHHACGEWVGEEDDGRWVESPDGMAVTFAWVKGLRPLWARALVEASSTAHPAEPS